MKKIITILNVRAIILICVGVIFGTWRDSSYREYASGGISRPGVECFYDQIESFFGGILFLWAGMNLIFNTSGFAKRSGRSYSCVEIFFARCFGLLLLILAGHSFSNVWTLNNLYHCLN